MENFDICFRDSSRTVIDKISFNASYYDALKNVESYDNRIF